MSWFKLALLLHIFGVIGFFVAFAMSVITANLIRRATSPSQLRDAMAISEKLPIAFGLSSTFILLSGIYMMIRVIQHHEPYGWIIVSLVLFLVISALGSTAGRKNGEELKRLVKDDDMASNAARQRALAASALSDAHFNATAALGIVVLMVFQPGVAVSIIIIVVALVVGFLTRHLLGSKHRVAPVKTKTP